MISLDNRASSSKPGHGVSCIVSKIRGMQEQQPFVPYDHWLLPTPNNEGQNLGGYQENQPTTSANAVPESVLPHFGVTSEIMSQGGNFVPDVFPSHDASPVFQQQPFVSMEDQHGLCVQNVFANQPVQLSDEHHQPFMVADQSMVQPDPFVPMIPALNALPMDQPHFGVTSESMSQVGNFVPDVFPSHDASLPVFQQQPFVSIEDQHGLCVQNAFANQPVQLSDEHHQPFMVADQSMVQPDPFVPMIAALNALPMDQPHFGVTSEIMSQGGNFVPDVFPSHDASPVFQQQPFVSMEDQHGLCVQNNVFVNQPVPLSDDLHQPLVADQSMVQPNALPMDQPHFGVTSESMSQAGNFVPDVFPSHDAAEIIQSHPVANADVSMDQHGPCFQNVFANQPVQLSDDHHQPLVADQSMVQPDPFVPMIPALNALPMDQPHFGVTSESMSQVGNFVPDVFPSHDAEIIQSQPFVNADVRMDQHGPCGQHVLSNPVPVPMEQPQMHQHPLFVHSVFASQSALPTDEPISLQKMLVGSEALVKVPSESQTDSKPTIHSPTNQASAVESRAVALLQPGQCNALVSEGRKEDLPAQPAVVKLDIGATLIAEVKGEDIQWDWSRASSYLGMKTSKDHVYLQRNKEYFETEFQYAEIPLSDFRYGGAQSTHVGSHSFSSGALLLMVLLCGINRRFGKDVKTNALTLASNLLRVAGTAFTVANNQLAGFLIYGHDRQYHEINLTLAEGCAIVGLGTILMHSPRARSAWGFLMDKGYLGFKIRCAPEHATLWEVILLALFFQECH